MSRIYYPGQRVQRGHTGEVGTVTAVTLTRVGVTYDNGGTDSQPASHGAWRPLPDRDSLYGAERPAAQPDDAHWTDTVVSQGHADYCAAWGHAARVGRCGRCGDIVPAAELSDSDPRPMERQRGSAYSLYVGTTPVFDAHTESGATLPAPMRGIPRDRVFGVWDGQAERVGVYQVQCADDAQALRIAYAAAAVTGNACVMVARDAQQSDIGSAYLVSAVSADSGNRTLPADPDVMTSARGYRFEPDPAGDEIAYLVWGADATVTGVAL
jgi:hypothetical protein